MQNRHQNREQYFFELASTSEKYYIPFISKVIPVNEHTQVLEIGCGEGGNLVPFTLKGCKVTGVDMATIRIEQAREIFKKKGYKGTLIAEDIFKLKELENLFDLIIIHDVIEHIDNKEAFLAKIRLYLKPGGVVFIGFPAWQMPFGGHQQICSSRFASKAPFIHLFPGRLYAFLLKCCSEKDVTIQELLEIKQTRCSIERFIKAVKKAQFSIVLHQLYFINPHYEIKFGLKPRKLSPVIGGIPYLRNFFCTSCFYIIKPTS